ncbi:MAG: hypothetical protein QY325_04945 [Flavobacteriales bacterium]|jgi:hypothetical protein|nr:MAG: hypothetical protein QY325_04945 [Flavobacteriales bacterium]
MDALGAITVLGTSIVKFLFAAAVSYGFQHTFAQTVLLLALGGAIGTVVFYLLGLRLLRWLQRRSLHRRAARIAQGLPPRKVFTRTNRFIVRVKRTYGLIGLAVMPPILSIPITSLVAAKYYGHDRRTLPYLLSAVVAWSVVLSTAWGFLR